MTVLGVTPAGPRCTCNAAPTANHTVECAIVAAAAPNAMVNGAGDVFYPDCRADADYFSEYHAAVWVNGPPPWASDGGEG